MFDQPRGASSVAEDRHPVSSAALAPIARPSHSAARTAACGCTRSRRKLLRAIDHVGGVLSVAYSPDGRTREHGHERDGEGLEHGHGRARSPVRTSARRPLRDLLARTGRVGDGLERSLRPSLRCPDGSQLARLDQIEIPTAAVFAPNGRRIVTTGQDELPHVWDTETGKLVTVLQGHSGNVLAAANPVGDRIATASTDGTARVWEAETGRLVLQLDGHTGFVEAVTYSPDGRQVLTSSRDGTARIWNAVRGGAGTTPGPPWPGDLRRVRAGRPGRSLPARTGPRGHGRSEQSRCCERSLQGRARSGASPRPGTGTIAEARADGTVTARRRAVD